MVVVAAFGDDVVATTVEEGEVSIDEDVVDKDAAAFVVVLAVPRSGSSSFLLSSLILLSMFSIASVFSSTFSASAALTSAISAFSLKKSLE